MEDKFITVKEAAEKLGLHVMTIYKLIKNKKLKGYCFGRAYRIARGDLDVFIKESKID